MNTDDNFPGGVVVEMINGNGQKYQKGLPLLLFQTDHFNEVAIENVFKQTGLKFEKSGFGYKAQPTNYEQIAKLFMVYNFKTRYHNNNTWKNTLMLKSDHHIGYEVDSICFECCQHNHIQANIKPEDRLSC